MSAEQETVMYNGWLILNSLETSNPEPPMHNDDIVWCLFKLFSKPHETVLVLLN